MYFNLYKYKYIDKHYIKRHDRNPPRGFLCKLVNYIYWLLINKLTLKCNLFQHKNAFLQTNPLKYYPCESQNNAKLGKQGERGEAKLSTGQTRLTTL
jgi:hypothetical protein